MPCSRSLLLPPLLLLALIGGSLARAASPAAIDVLAAGAVPDGVTVNTRVLQQAIDTCHDQGGGTVYFPPGRYVTGTIQLKDHVRLHLADQAVILGSTNPADYRNLDPFRAGDGVPQGFALLVADGASEVGVDGGGTVDGRGRELKAAQIPFQVRPFLMRWLRCSGVTVRDVHLTNPGAWTLNCFQTRDALIDHVTIRTRSTGLANNDGIDLDSCEHIRVRNCDIESGDDALCLKATSPRPCRDIAASGCLLSTKCNALKLGTESLGDFESISLTDCAIRNTGMAGIALYAVDGAHLHHVTIANVTMDGVSVPISIRLGARLKTFRAGDQAKPVGELRDITIRNVRVTGARLVGVLVNGVPGHPVEALTLDNISIRVAGGGTAADAAIQLPEKAAAYPEYNMFGKVLPAYGLYLRHVRGVTFHQVRIGLAAPDARPAVALVDVTDVTPAGFTPELAASNIPPQP